MKFGCILITIIILVLFNVSFISTAKAVECGGGSGACSSGSSCCSEITGECDVSNAPVIAYTCDWTCDGSENACLNCCAGAGWCGADECSTGCAYVGDFVWMGSGKCCGDDYPEYFSSGAAGYGCCCDYYQVGEGDDEICTGDGNNYWCVDGTYCTTNEVYDSSLSATDSTYILSGDDIVCNCANSGNKCDDGDSDATADGLCASSACDTG
ncbi:MAG: hypothetical protein ABIH52_02415, partial [Candidatus Aenigmatarchaeota archaeon]